MSPEIEAASNDFLWKGVFGIITALSSALSGVFLHLMRSKSNEVTRANARVEAVESAREDARKAAIKREDDIRAGYDVKIEQLRREKSAAVRQRSKTARMAEEALAYGVSGASDRPPADDDEEDESTGVHDVRAESREYRVQDEVRRRKEAARKLELEQALKKFVTSDSGPPSAPPPKQPYRGRLPSRR